MKKIWQHWLEMSERSPILSDPENEKPKSAIKREAALRQLRAKASKHGLTFTNVDAHSLWAFCEYGGGKRLAGKKASLRDHANALEENKYFIYKRYL